MFDDRLPVRRTFAALSLVALVATGCLPTAAGHPAGNSSRIELDPQNPEFRDLGKLKFRGGLALSGAGPDFGGLSGLRVSEDGRRLIAVSDRGSLVTGRLAYGDDGDLIAAGDIGITPLIDADGDPVSRTLSDAEGLTRLADGRWAVSFERRHRIETYPPDPDGPRSRPVAKPLSPPGIDKAPGNGGLESITTLADGRLLAIEEGAEAWAGKYRAWIRGKAGWESLIYSGMEPFRPTDAATLPSGDVLVLEREASFIGGFRVRIVRVEASAIRPGAVVTGTELARLEAPYTSDNFEGISAIPGPNGSTLIYIVSDDNFWMLQRTLLMMFELPAGT